MAIDIVNLACQSSVIGINLLKGLIFLCSNKGQHKTKLVKCIVYLILLIVFEKKFNNY